MSNAKKYTIYFPDPVLLRVAEKHSKKQKLSLNEFIRQAVEIATGYSKDEYIRSIVRDELQKVRAQENGIANL